MTDMAHTTRGGGPISRRAALGVAAGVVGGVALGAGRSRSVAAQQPMGPQQVAGLTRLAEDFFFWSNSGYNTFIILTDDGVIIGDPCSQMSPRNATLLKAVVSSFSDKPVRYVVYSHEHTDHNTGGEVFAGTALFVAHTNAGPKIAAAADARGIRRDQTRAPVPTVLVDDAMTIELGGTHVELRYMGRNHSDNSLVVLYRRAMVAVDFIPVKSLPFRTLQDGYMDEWVQGLERIEQELDVDLLLPGHGAIAPKATVGEVRQYFLDLAHAIRAAQGQGLADNSEEMVAAVRAALMPAYGTWANFGPFLPENIEGMLRNGFTF